VHTINLEITFRTCHTTLLFDELVLPLAHASGGYFQCFNLLFNPFLLLCVLEMPLLVYFCNSSVRFFLAPCMFQVRFCSRILAFLIVFLSAHVDIFVYLLLCKNEQSQAVLKMLVTSLHTLFSSMQVRGDIRAIANLSGSKAVFTDKSSLCDRKLCGRIPPSRLTYCQPVLEMIREMMSSCWLNICALKEPPLVV